MSENLWRILDANLNRCNEGLRVLEDWCRFVAERGDLSGRLKHCRHRLQEISCSWSVQELLSARNSLGDVGRVIETESEYQRQDDLALLQANFHRAQQSIRVLEESAKRLHLASRELEALRYAIYDLHKEVVLLAVGMNNDDSVGRLHVGPALSEAQAAGRCRRERLRKARLYVLTDLCGGVDGLIQHIQRLIRGGADVVQLRDKQADDRTLLLAAIASARLCRDSDVLFIVNDRPDLAVAAGADGVHVGQEELPVSVVRHLLGSELLIGLSTHDVPQVTAAFHDSDCDYLGVGPIFSSQTKSFSSHVGTDLLQDVVNLEADLFNEDNSSCDTDTDDALPNSFRSIKPAFAIGGINATNLPQVTAAGFHRVAIQNSAGQGDEVVQRLQDFRHGLKTIS